MVQAVKLASFDHGHLCEDAEQKVKVPLFWHGLDQLIYIRFIITTKILSYNQVLYLTALNVKVNDTLDLLVHQMRQISELWLLNYLRLHQERYRVNQGSQLFVEGPASRPGQNQGKDHLVEVDLLGVLLLCEHLHPFFDLDGAQLRNHRQVPFTNLHLISFFRYGL